MHCFPPMNSELEENKLEASRKKKSFCVGVCPKFHNHRDSSSCVQVRMWLSSKQSKLFLSSCKLSNRLFGENIFIFRNIELIYR